TEVIMEPMVIEVHGVPAISSHDRMTDQLKIHFLKRSNCGGDVLMVIYPTSTPGQAFVIFESPEVPKVLEWKHILEVDSRFYPIGVKKALLSEVDMPVETSLDLSMFPKQENTVLKCLVYYGFNVKYINADHVQLHGSFLKLKLLRSKLMQLQDHEHQSHESSSTAFHNGTTLGYGMGRNSVDP
ncbi:RNA-binding protein 43, partial [Clarias magur]